MKLNESEIAFLKQLSGVKATWESTVQKVISSSEPELIWSFHSEAWLRLSQIIREAGVQREMQEAISELLYGIIHSVLVTFDGGTPLADKTQLKITDSQGHEFIRFLHEFWPEYSGNTL